MPLTRGDGSVGAMNLWSFCPRDHTHLAASECRLLTRGETVMARNAGKGLALVNAICQYGAMWGAQPASHLGHPHSRSSLGQQVKRVSPPTAHSHPGHLGLSHCGWYPLGTWAALPSRSFCSEEEKIRLEMGSGNRELPVQCSYMNKGNASAAR